MKRHLQSIFAAAGTAMLRFIVGAALSSSVWAAEYRLVVQDVYPEADGTGRTFQPLAAYLSDATGQAIELVTQRSPLAHWEGMRKLSDYDLVMDAAHFTDYRAKRFGYHVLAKVSGALSFSIVTGPNTLILDLEDLLGKPLATPASPSLGAARLASLFPDPIRTPVVLEVDSTTMAVEKVLTGEAFAALIPSNAMKRFPNLNVVATTEGAPAMAFSAAPSVDESVRRAIKEALLTSADGPAGRRMLAEAGLAGFEPATAATYDGYAKLLAGTWGYQEGL